jgi:3-hydroxyisobutyrate dehydrogenase
LNADYEVHVFNRTQSKAMPLVEAGAVLQESPAAIAQNTDVIFTMVGYPSDVEQVYLGEAGVFEGLSAGKIIVDMTTSTPTLAEELAEKAAELGVESLDAPVSGGDLGAQNGTLTIMVGGPQAAFDKLTPIFKYFSADLNRFGEAGSGQHTKMANQIMVAGTMTGLTEMMVYAKEAGLDLDRVVKTVNGGAARNWSLENYGPRILKEDYSPGFFVKHFVKDLKIALDEAEKMNLDLPATKQAYALYETLENSGYADEGTQSLIKLWWD